MFRRCLANRSRGLKTFRNSTYVDIIYDKQFGGTVAGSKIRAGLCCGRCLRLILKIQGYGNHEVTDRGGVVSFYVTFSCLPHVTHVAAGAGGGR